MFLKSEVVTNVFEYTKGKLLVHVASRDLLVLNNWQIVYKFIEPDFGNTLKQWFGLLPGFDPESFPFIICSGWHTFNLINIKDFHMERLV